MQIFLTAGGFAFFRESNFIISHRKLPRPLQYTLALLLSAQAYAHTKHSQNATDNVFSHSFQHAIQANSAYMTISIGMDVMLKTPSSMCYIQQTENTNLVQQLVHVFF